MPKRRYTDDDRATAVAAVHANAGNVRKTARELGVPAKTLEHWMKGTAHPEAAKDGAEKKAPLADRFEALAHKMLGIADGKADKLNAKDATTAAAIAVDKMRLLRGEATSIDEHRDDERLAEFRRRYAAKDAAADAGADGAGQPADPARPVAEADGVPGA